MTALLRPAKTCPRCSGRYETDALFCAKDGAALDDPNPPEPLPSEDPNLGTVVAGDILLQSIAGTGAMGRVYRAHQRSVDRHVAVKILHRELSANKQLVARFNREAKIASKLQHPHVVEMFLAGQLADGSLYTVMEFLDGVSLASALREAGGTFALERALAITIQICDAAGAAHARGIVHRDMKPENVMLIDRDDVTEWVKVLDFGIAKLTLGDQSMETAAGLIFGTARYISPEGAQGRPVGPPGDVYAIATMLFEMLAGRTPFQSEPLGLLIKHIHEPAPELRSINAAGASVPEPIARAVAENLGKDPEQRAANGRAFAAALIAAARESNLSLPEIGAIGRMSQLPHPPPSSRDGAASSVEDLGAASTPIPLPGSVIAEPRPARDSKNEERAAPVSGWRSARLLVLGASLGAAISSAVLYKLVFRPDEERRLYQEHVRLVLAEGHYVKPPGDNVRELVDEGMKRWPNDGTLRQMKSAAEKEMITMAIAARESGDLVGAHYLASEALEVEGTDNSARYMRAQCEKELAEAKNGTTTAIGPPRLIFESPPLVKPGVPVEMTGKIVFGASNPQTTRVTAMKISVHPNGKSRGGPPVTLVSSDPAAIRATLTSPTAIGSYDVAFEVDVGGTTVRAMRDLDVAP